eukprot:917931-Pleurochrysis_carterae.AAC.1
MAENVWRYVLSIRQVHAGGSTPSKAYLAINAAHGLYAAFHACHGSPHFINLGFLVVHRTSTSKENHRFHQVPQILILPWLLTYTIIVAITELGERNRLAIKNSRQPPEGIQGITDRVGDACARLVRRSAGLASHAAGLASHAAGLASAGLANHSAGLASHCSPDAPRGPPDAPRGPPDAP